MVSVRAVRVGLVKRDEKHLTMKGRKWWTVTLTSCWNEVSSSGVKGPPPLLDESNRHTPDTKDDTSIAMISVSPEH